MASAEILDLIARVTVASLAIGIVFLLRKPARTAFGPQVAYGLWLLVPAAVIAGLIPRRVVLPAPAEFTTVGGQPTLDAAAPAATIPDALAQPVGTAFELPDISTALLLLWALGALVSVLIVAVDHQRMIARLRLRRDGSLFRSASEAAGPAVVGVFLPRIVVPAGFEQRYDATEQALVIAHEREHIRAGDAQINALAAAAQCLNWFNPLFYAARKALRIDQELACDDRVMRRHGAKRRAYAEAMLKTQLSAEAIPLGCHWPALGAKALSERIAMLGRPAPKPMVRAAGAFACASAVVAGSAAAWAAQEPQLTYAQPARPSAPSDDRSMGGKLVEALAENDVAEARLLIAAGADVNHFRPGDGTPLTLAAREGHTDMGRALLDAGADVNRAAPGDGNPLIIAAGSGRLDLVELFVKAGASVNGFVEGDETPLIAAARENRLAAARYLIASGADVDYAVTAPTLRGFERRSPLGMAERNGHAEMAQLLREHGAQK